MSIKIYRDDAANAVFIFKNNVGAQFTNSLHAEESTDLSTINVINLSKSDAVTDFYEFFEIGATEFLDENGVMYSADVFTCVNILNAIFQAVSSPSGNPPTITSGTSITVVEGDTINYQITTNIGDNPHYFNERTSSNRPDGVVFNPITGLLSGVADVGSSGSYTMVIDVINHSGATQLSLSITVDAGVGLTNTKSINYTSNKDHCKIDDAVLDSSAFPLYRASNGTGSSDAWSISSWVKPSMITSTDRYLFEYDEMYLFMDGNGLEFRYGTSSNNLQLETSFTFSTNTWYHITVTYDGGTTGSGSGSVNDYYSRFTIFIDGAEYSTGQGNITASHNNYGYSSGMSDRKLYISKNNNNSFRGCNDEVSLWSRELSQSDVTEIYNSGIPTNLASHTNVADLYEWWRMGDGDTYPTLLGQQSNLDLIMHNMTVANIVTDSP